MELQISLKCEDKKHLVIIETDDPAIRVTVSDFTLASVKRYQDVEFRDYKTIVESRTGG